MEFDSAKFRYWRRVRALSMRDLAASAGVAYATVFSLEHDGKRPQPRTIRRLAEALGIDPIELLTSAPTPTESVPAREEVHA